MPKMNRCRDQRKTRKILRKVEIVIGLLSDMVISTHFQTSSSDESRVLLANLVKKTSPKPFQRDLPWSKCNLLSFELSA